MTTLAVNPVTRRDLLALIVILVLAAATRFYQLDITQYRYDQALLAGIAEDTVAGKYFPTEGLTASLGIPTPPAMVLIMSLPYAISSNPLVAQSFIVLLNVAGVACLWLIAHRYFSSTVGLVAGFGYALSPWAVAFSREVWSPDFNTPFILAGFLCGLLGFAEGKRWAQILSLPLICIGVEIHPNSVMLLTIYLWFLLRWRKNASWGAVALSVALVLLTLSPYLLSFTDTRLEMFRTAISREREVAALGGTSPIRVLANFASGAGVESALMPLNIEPVEQAPTSFWIISAIPIVLGFIVIVIRRHPLAPMLFLWAFTGAVALFIFQVKPYPHYLIPSLPALFLFAGVGLDFKGRLHPVLLTAWAAIMLIQSIFWLSLLNRVSVDGTLDYRPLLANILPIRERLLDESDVIIVGGESGISGYDVWSTLLFREASCVREMIIADGGIAVFPAHPFALLYAPNAADYEFTDLYQSDQQLEISLRAGEGSYRIDRLEAAPPWTEPEFTPLETMRFGNGVSLNGYRFHNGRLYLDWALTQQGAEDYKYYTHLLDENGERIAQRDPSFYAGKYWCAGDRIVTWAEMELPPAAARFRIGMYRFVDGNIIGSNIVYESGNTAPWIEIPISGAD